MTPLENKMAELRARFAESAIGQAGELQRLVSSGNFDEARLIAHGLAGRSGMFGYDELGAIALAADEAAPADLPVRLEDLISALLNLAQVR